MFAPAPESVTRSTYAPGTAPVATAKLPVTVPVDAMLQVGDVAKSPLPLGPDTTDNVQLLELPVGKPLPETVIPLGEGAPLAVP